MHLALLELEGCLTVEFNLRLIIEIKLIGVQELALAFLHQPATGGMRIYFISLICSICCE